MKSFFVSVSLVIILTFSLKYCKATDLRGRIQTYNQYSNLYFPVANVRVELWYFNVNVNSWVCGPYTTTGEDGMYYFYNIIANFDYYIRVNGKFFPLHVFPQP